MRNAQTKATMNNQQHFDAEPAPPKVRTSVVFADNPFQCDWQEFLQIFNTNQQIHARLITQRPLFWKRMFVLFIYFVFVFCLLFRICDFWVTKNKKIIKTKTKKQKKIQKKPPLI